MATSKRPFVVFGYIKPTAQRWVGWYAGLSHEDVEKQALHQVPGLVVVRSVMGTALTEIDPFNTISELGAVEVEPPQ